jgi:hypothetical protein
MLGSRKYALLLAVLSLLWRGLPLKGSTIQVPTGSWVSASSMAAPRSGAATVLLQDGRLLITGGDSGSGALASAEFFDTSGSLSAAPPMNFAHSNHTAVVLQDGRVLVAGGLGSAGIATDVAEIYDPVANAWTTTGPLMVGRSRHTASLLQDGTVLIGGGDNSGTPQNSLEIFNPASNTFTLAAGVLSSPRVSHAAAMLHDGRVLFAGGFDGTKVLASSDIYNPSSGTVSPGPVLSSPRQGHTTTTQLDGRVLVAGGNDGNNDLASAEIYDPAAGVFAPAGGVLKVARRDHLAFLLPHNGSLLIVGGTSVGNPIASAEQYVPWTGLFNTTGGLASARSGATGSPLSQDGLLLVAGGKDASGASLATSELYGFSTVKTDKPDYPPGSTVTITGSGWKPGETVALSFLESPNIDTPGPFTAIADANGNITNSDFSPDQYDVNVLFYLTAVGQDSGYQAQTTFTDKNNDTLDVDPKNYNHALHPGDAIPAGDIFTYTVSNTGGGTSFPVGLSVSLTGAFGNASPTSGNIGGYGNGFSTTVSGTVPCSQAPGSVTLNVVGTLTSGTGTVNPDHKNSTINVTVTNPPNASCSVATSTTLISSANPSASGQGVSFTATVAPGSGTTAPTGTVQFAVDSTNLGSPVTLTASGSNGVATSISYSTLSVGSHTVTATYTPTGSFGGSNGSLTQTVNKADQAAVTVTGPADVTYGTAGTATATGGSGTGAYSFSAGSSSGCSVSGTTVSVTNASGTCVLTATRAGDNNYNDSAASAPFTANLHKANQAAVTVTGPADVTYGTAGAATATGGSGTGAYSFSAGSSTGCSVSGTTASVTNASGTCVLTATRAGDNNYNDSAASAPFTVGLHKANATVTVNGYTGVYDASPHSATGTATGVNGEDLSALLHLGSSFTDVPGGTVNWAFDGNNNYNSAGGTASITINQADTTTTVTGGTFAYDGNPHPATVSVTGAGGLNLTPASAAPVHVGDTPCSASYTFAGDTNHKSSSGSATIIITKAASNTTVSGGGSFVFDGNPHPASVSVTGAGGLSLTPEPSYSCGSAPVHVTSCTASYTFAGDGDHDGSTDSATITITKAASTTTVTGGTFPFDGNPHPASVSVTGAGGLNLTPEPSYSCGSAPVHVANTPCTASYTFAGDGDHDGSSDSATITITKAASTTTVSGGGDFVFDGNPHPATVSVTGVGGLNLTPAPTYSGSCSAAPVHVADTTCTAKYTFAGDGDHDGSSGEATITITKAASTTTIGAGYTVTYDGKPHGVTASVTGAGGLNQSVPVTYTPPGDVTVPVNAGTYTASANYGGDPDHLGSSAGPVTISINQATPAFSSPSSPTIILGTNSVTLSGKIAAGLLVPPGSVSITLNSVTQTAAIRSADGSFSSTFATGSLPVSAAGYAIAYSYAGSTNFKSANSTATLAVHYASGTLCGNGMVGHQIQQPIDLSGTSVFKMGSTVPTKFTVCDVNGVPVGAPGVVTAYGLVGMAQQGTDPVNELAYSTTPDTAFRWDSGAQQWIFNQGTKGNGTLNLVNTMYLFQINLNDGTYINFSYKLK